MKRHKRAFKLAEYGSVSVDNALGNACRSACMHMKRGIVAAHLDLDRLVGILLRHGIYRRLLPVYAQIEALYPAFEVLVHLFCPFFGLGAVEGPLYIIKFKKILHLLGRKPPAELDRDRPELEDRHIRDHKLNGVS